MLDDFLAFALDGEQPARDAQERVPNGVRWTWLDDGIAALRTRSTARRPHSVLASAGIHGDETAPIEMLSTLVADIAQRHGGA